MPAEQITLLQMNDSHAYFTLHQEAYFHPDGIRYAPAGGYGRIAAIAARIRKEMSDRMLFLDNGDALHGTAPAVRSQGKIVVPVLNALGINAMTGHWEFAYGIEELHKRVEEMKFPFLAANVYHKNTSQLIFAPWSVQETGGIRVGIIGLAAFIVDKTMPASFHKGLTFTLGKEELPAVIQTLREIEKVDLVVLLSHLGLPQDLKLVSEVHGIDICLSGHTHNRLWHPIVRGRTVVMQSGSQGSFLGRLDVAINGGVLTSWRHEMIPVEEAITPQPEVEQMVREIVTGTGLDLGEMVGQTLSPLDRATAMESTMDNFLLAALMEATGADVAFSNGWRYGAPIVPGPICLNDLYDMVPMDSPVETVVLRGEEILSMLEENLERTYACDPYGQMGGYVKRCAGLRTFVKIENPAGTRIQALFIGNEPLDPNRRYRAAFITEQGVPGKYGEERSDTGERCIAALRRYLGRHSPITFPLQETFTVV